MGKKAQEFYDVGATMDTYINTCEEVFDQATTEYRSGPIKGRTNASHVCGLVAALYAAGWIDFGLEV
jgi:hypothetical protein